jgi:hypothetical protein
MPRQGFCCGNLLQTGMFIEAAAAQGKSHICILGAPRIAMINLSVVHFFLMSFFG